MHCVVLRLHKISSWHKIWHNITDCNPGRNWMHTSCRCHPADVIQTFLGYTAVPVITTWIATDVVGTFLVSRTIVVRIAPILVWNALAVVGTFLASRTLGVITTEINTDVVGASLVTRTIVVRIAPIFVQNAPPVVGAFPCSRTLGVTTALFRNKTTGVVWTLRSALLLPWRAILVGKTFSAPRSIVATVSLPKEISNVAPAVGHFDAFTREEVRLSPRRSSSECLAISVWAALLRRRAKNEYGNSWGHDGEGKNNFEWNHFVKISQSIPQE